MIFSSYNNDIKNAGRLGNACMRVMSLMGFAKKYSVPWAIPDWKYAKYFSNDIPQVNETLNIRYKVQEPAFHYCPEFWDRVNWSQDVDIKGFLQSPKYWHELLQFKKGYLAALRRKYDFSNNPIAISMRLGKDMTNNPCYYKVNPMYYISALNHFPDCNERSLFIFSDNMPLARNYFSFTKEAIFIDAEDIEQMAVMTLCGGHIISQSTFSYVGAYLSQSEKVIRPLRNFDGEFAKKNSEKDYWPENKNWIVHEHRH